jgi:hypothetical protein
MSSAPSAGSFDEQLARNRPGQKTLSERVIAQEGQLNGANGRTYRGS